MKNSFFIALILALTVSNFASAEDNTASNTEVTVTTDASQTDGASSDTTVNVSTDAPASSDEFVAAPESFPEAAKEAPESPAEVVPAPEPKKAMVRTHVKKSSKNHNKKHQCDPEAMKNFHRQNEIANQKDEPVVKVTVEEQEPQEDCPSDC